MDSGGGKAVLPPVFVLTSISIPLPGRGQLLEDGRIKLTLATIAGFPDGPLQEKGQGLPALLSSPLWNEMRLEAAPPGGSSACEPSPILLPGLGRWPRGAPCQTPDQICFFSFGSSHQLRCSGLSLHCRGKTQDLDSGSKTEVDRGLWIASHSRLLWQPESGGVQSVH